jgi:hypothetical protein
MATASKPVRNITGGNSVVISRMRVDNCTFTVRQMADGTIRVTPKFHDDWRAAKQTAGGRMPSDIRPYAARSVRAPSPGVSASVRAARQKAAASRYAGKGTAGTTPSLNSRECTVKLNVAKASSLVAHVKYIDKTNNLGVSFGASDEMALDIKDEVARWAEAEDKFGFKAVIAPPGTPPLTPDQMKEFVRATLAGWEKNLGVKLEWVAAAHYDSDMPHAHVIVRGKHEEHTVGRDGQARSKHKQLRLSPVFMNFGARYEAQHSLTAQLGVRTPAEVEATNERRSTLSYLRDKDELASALAYASVWQQRAITKLVKKQQRERRDYMNARAPVVEQDQLAFKADVVVFNEWQEAYLFGDTEAHFNEYRTKGREAAKREETLLAKQERQLSSELTAAVGDRAPMSPTEKREYLANFRAMKSSQARTLGASGAERPLEDEQAITPGV